MTAVNHALTGATVAAAINRPILSLPAALLSHFVIDALPHWNYKLPGIYRQLAIMFDITLSLSLLVVLAVTVDASQRLIIAGGFLGILPDLMWAPHIFYGQPSPTDRLNLLHKLRRLHIKIQWSETRKGAYVEAAWFIAMLFLIYQVGS
jgi:hypothetical protein